MQKHLVYLHKNKINNKVYVGQTYYNDPKKRWGKNGIKYKNQGFYLAIIKYGWDNFEHIILERDIDENLINEREAYWINYYNATDPKYGYNRTDGAGYHSEEVRQLMSQNWSKHFSAEEKREWMISYNKTADRTGINNSMYGKKRSGKNAGNKKKVQCLETGEVFETVSDASRWLTGKPYLRSHIAEQIQGKRKSCGTHPVTNEKLHWKYIEENRSDDE